MPVPFEAYVGAIHRRREVVYIISDCIRGVYPMTLDPLGGFAAGLLGVDTGPSLQVHEIFCMDS